MKAFDFFRNSWSVVYFTLFLYCVIPGNGQTTSNEYSSTLTLQQCIDYALKNQPLVRQSRLDEDINNRDIAISLSGWFPQLSLDAGLQHYLQLPTSFFPNLNDPAGPEVEVTTGLFNTSSAQFSANQSLYSTDLVFASKTVRDLRQRARQNTESSEINTVVNVSKSFYDVMLTLEQLDLWNDEILRLERTYNDAYHLYQNGLTDKIDYQQAMISVNNAKAQKRNTEEAIKGKYSFLKQTMGLPPEKRLIISYDSSSFEKNISADTIETLSYDKRIEYQLMQTDLHLQNAEVGYYRWSFMPALSAFYDYNLNFANNSFSPLYNINFPNSLIGLKLTLPIFQGDRRLQNLRKAHLQYQRLKLGQDYLKSQINTEYSQALASYKSNLYALEITKTNIAIAQDVFNSVILQYTQGVKTYLDVIVAETDLRSAKLNYLSTLFQVLSAKLDLNAAMGDIAIN
ncbi:MAG: TolC family protein [Bacteroidales bacterium]|jgi:outer membrane protein TolC|nr:TolC family protein [Bacteroidales bacterium]